MWFKNTYRFSPFYKQILNKIPYIKDVRDSSFKLQARIKTNDELLKIKKPNILGIKTKIKKTKINKA